MGKTMSRDLAAMFAAGASDAYESFGMSEKDAEYVAKEMCKIAAKRYVVADDDDDEEEDTWWSRNSGWVLPSAIGAGALLLGAHSAKSPYARADRDVFSNAFAYTLEKFKRLMGRTDDPRWLNLVDASYNKPKVVSSNKDIDPGGNNPMYRHFMGKSE